jgi:Pentapeptide repeats (8 copies)
MTEDTQPPITPPARHPERYEMMAILADSDPLPTGELAKVVEQHAQFVESGGAGGRWETFCTPGDHETGLVIGVYVKRAPGGERGAQADLSHKRLAGRSLRGLQLPYANLSGVICTGQDLSGANLEGSLLVDSDWSGSILRGAMLAHADLSRADLRDCDLRDANLTGADLENADLTGSDLRGSLREGARIPGTWLEGCRFGESEPK